jgi:pilus assembly protein CpaE
VLRTLILSPDREVTAQLQRVLAEVEGANVVRVVGHRPDAIELSRILRSNGPQVVFLSTADIDYCGRAAAHIEAIMPGLQTVAVGRNADPELLMTIMRSGIREFLAFPFDRSAVQSCVGRLAENLRNRPLTLTSSDYVYSFVPAKPGVGATTLAIGAALSVAGEDTPTLLADFDFNCGMIRFMLKLDSEHSIMDALQHAGSMDEQLWPQLVTRTAGIDVLHAGHLNPDLRIESLNIQHLLEYARRNYKMICLDMSGNLEKYSVELMHESKRIFLVCTPEVTSLHLAREKMMYLHRLDLGPRVRILLNRQTRKSSISAADVEQLVGAPVQFSFPNDYAGVNRAIADGTGLQKASEFGRQCAALAELMAERNVQTLPEKRRFVQYFNLTPARFSFETRRSG